MERLAIACVTARVLEYWARNLLKNLSMISDFFHPDVGGVENHIYMLSTELIRRGHKVRSVNSADPRARLMQRNEGYCDYPWT